MNTISLDKKYQTRSGCDVVLHSVQGPDNEMPVVVSIAMQRSDGRKAWMPYYYSMDGRYFKEPAGPNPMDLVEAPPAVAEKSYWVNAYRNPDALGGIVLGYVYGSEQEAEDGCVSPHRRIQCLEFKVPSE